jgi:hypothetical protein
MLLNRYKDFSTDLLLEKAINESFIYYTKEFKDTLSRMKSKSKIAQDLLDVEYTDVKPDMTFISLGDKEGDIKFTQFKKALSILKKAIETKYPDNTTLYDYIDKKLSDGSISQSDINTLYNETDWGIKDKSRNSTGIGRLVNQIFPGKYTSKEVEDFVNSFKNVNKPGENELKLVKGQDIKKYYLYTNYVEEIGDLGNSCMRYTRCQEYLDIYVENPNQVQLLVYLNEEDKVLGRALLWVLNDEKSDDIEGAEYFLDRIYGIDDSIKKLFQEHAETKGWAWRTKSGYSDTKYITYKGEEHSGVKMSIKLDKCDFDYYPYMDTFKELDNSESKLYNNNDEDRNWTLNHTDGTYEDNNGVWSDWEDRRIPVDEAVYSEWLDTHIYERNAVEISLGNRRYRGWWPREHDNIVYDQFREEYIHNNDSTYSEYLDCSFYDEDSIDVITWVDDDIYSQERNRFRFQSDNVSDQWNGYISHSKMDCSDYMGHNGDYLAIIEDQTKYDDYTGKHYFIDLEVTVYETEEYGPLVKEDCDILGVKPNGKSWKTDELAYLFRNKHIEEILEKARKQVKDLEVIESGKQTRIEFEDDEEYMKKVKQKIRNLNWRIGVLENWLD